MECNIVLKVGLDIHGVIDQHPVLYSILSHALVNAGHEVHVITGMKYEDMEADLDKWGIAFTHYFSIYQHLEDQGKPMTRGDRKNPFFDQTDWNAAKGWYCTENNVDIHIDDTELYADHFDPEITKFLLARNPNGSSSS